jgi:hypothetical protein
MITRHSLLFLSALASLPACAISSSGTSLSGDGAAGKADQISGADDPSGLLGSADRRLSQLISAGDIGSSFGVPDELVPSQRACPPTVVAIPSLRHWQNF